MSGTSTSTGAAACRRLTLLDVGAGQGFLGRCLREWAGTRGWDWTFTDLDLSEAACARNPNPRAVTGSATTLPFQDRQFDVVIANTMTHHLPSDDSVVAHFREASRVAGRLVLICDMQRQLPFLLALGLVLWVKRVPAEFRQDGLLSVRRGWKHPEWRRLADAAGLREARVWTEHGSRILLAEVKSSSVAS